MNCENRIIYCGQRACIYLAIECTVKFAIGIAAMMFVFAISTELLCGQSIQQATLLSVSATAIAFIAALGLGIAVSIYSLLIGAAPGAISRFKNTRIIVHAIFIHIKQYIQTFYTQLQAAALIRSWYTLAITYGWGVLTLRRSPHLLYPLTCCLLIYH